MINQLSHQSLNFNFEISEKAMVHYKNMWHSREKDQCDGPPEELKPDNAIKIMLSDSNFTYTLESQKNTLDDQCQLHQRIKREKQETESFSSPFQKDLKPH